MEKLLPEGVKKCLERMLWVIIAIVLAFAMLEVAIIKWLRKIHARKPRKEA
jgi:hypothetical protein